MATTPDVSTDGVNCFNQNGLDQFVAILDNLPDAIAVHDVVLDAWGVITDLKLSWWNKTFQERRVRQVRVGDSMKETYFLPDSVLSYVNTAWEEGEALQVFQLCEDTKPYYTHSDQNIDVVVIWKRYGQHIVESTSGISEVVALREHAENQQSLIAIASRKRAMAIERERIARNLHDVVIQNLYATSLSLSMAGKRVGAIAEEEFNRAIHALERIIGEIRNEILDLESQKTSQLRLRLEDTLIPILNPTHAEFDLFIEVPTLLEDVQAHIRAVCLEAASNAVRHGGASRLRIRISRHGEELFLTIADNGCGIPDECTRQNGLQNMRQRALSLGGKMEIYKPPPRRHDHFLVYSLPTVEVMIGVAICDDHVMVREALASVIAHEDGLEVVGVTDSIASTRALLHDKVPDVLVADVRLDGESGLDVARSVIAEYPHVKVIVLTSFKSDEALVAAYELGASAFVLKSGSSDGLVNTIKDVASGMKLINPAEVRTASESLEKQGLGMIRRLDANDRHIARLIALGYSDKQIAETVFLGLQTVRNRVSRMLSRFGKENRTQLALFFSEHQSEIADL